MIGRPRQAACLCLVLLVLVGAARAGNRAGRQDAVTGAELTGAIDQLGSLEYETRTEAARTVRRAEPALAVPTLLRAAIEHPDGYVRFRALVLLSGFNDPRARDVMEEVLAGPNDRLRTVAYAYFEHHPDPAMVPVLLDALNREESEFVRPALVRALAAHAGDQRVRTTLLGEVGRGQDFFRSTVIEALGDYQATWSLDALEAIARLDGPLRNDAVLSLGKLGDRRAMETLAELQRAALRQSQPSLAAAICLLGVNCPTHQRFLRDTLRFGIANPGFQELVRTAAAGLGTIAARGDAESLVTLLDIGVPSRDPERAPIALAVGLVALRNAPLLISTLESYHNLDGAAVLLQDAFDMLEEDYEEERFFAAVRRTYWQAGEGSATRDVCEALIRRLDF